MAVSPRWVARARPVWARRLHAAAHKNYAMRGRCVVAACQGSLSGRHVATHHPQGSLGGHNPLCGQDVLDTLSIPLLVRRRQYGHRCGSPGRGVLLSGEEQERSNTVSARCTLCRGQVVVSLTALLPYTRFERTQCPALGLNQSRGRAGTFLAPCARQSCHHAGGQSTVGYLIGQLLEVRCEPTRQSLLSSDALSSLRRQHKAYCGHAVPVS
jgi:hypothetical protein